MVLTRIMPAAALLLALAGCLTPAKTLRLDQPRELTLVVAIDAPARPVLLPPPASLEAALTEELALRNVTLRALPQARVAEIFGRSRNSDRRLERVKSAEPGADLLLLLELAPHYSSQIRGRFRWDVDARASLLATAVAEDMLRDDFDVPAFLDFHHQDGTDAVDNAAGVLADRLGDLLDSYLSEAKPADAT